MNIKLDDFDIIKIFNLFKKRKRDLPSSENIKVSTQSNTFQVLKTTTDWTIVKCNYVPLQASIKHWYVQRKKELTLNLSSGWGRKYKST
jgi:hypothetical protein